MLNRTDQKNRLDKLIDFLMVHDYFGDMIIKFNHGNIVHTEMHKDIKLETLNLTEISVMVERRKTYMERVGKTKLKDSIPLGTKKELEGAIK